MLQNSYPIGYKPLVWIRTSGNGPKKFGEVLRKHVMKFKCRSDKNSLILVKAGGRCILWRPESGPHAKSIYLLCFTYYVLLGSLLCFMVDDMTETTSLFETL